jgi:hypothetical protein
VRVTAVLRSDIPPLAWAVVQAKGIPSVLLVHGRHVHVRGDAFVEGAWSGDFSEMTFERATTFCGSGGHVHDDGLTVSTSTDTLHPLYVVRLTAAIVVSNSMLFALEGTGSALDRRYRYHDVDVMSIVLGVRDAAKSLPTDRGTRLELYYHCNLRIGHSLAIRVESKSRAPRLTTFHDYVSFLQSEVSAVISNATAGTRAVRFSPLATLSSGYDSPACAVLAKAAGCREALTLSAASAAFGSASDSGTAVGHLLNFETHEADPSWYMRQSDLAEAEFLAPGYGGDDVIYGGAEGLLRGRLLITGYHGDRVWSRFGTEDGRVIERGDPSGGSLLEFRLRRSFQVLAVPFIGCTNLADIRRLSNSHDMRQWSVASTAYDRPIPRRIVEEAGVPRELFGVTKRAAARPFRAADIQDPDLKTVLSPASYEDFERWSATIPVFMNWRDRAVYAVLHGTQELVRHGVSTLARLFPGAIGLRAVRWYRRRRTGIPWRYAKPRNRHSLLLFWSHERLRGRYVALPTDPLGDRPQRSS